MTKNTPKNTSKRKSGVDRDIALQVTGGIITKLVERTAVALVRTPTHEFYRRQPTDVEVRMLAKSITYAALEDVLWTRIKLNHAFDVI